MGATGGIAELLRRLAQPVNVGRFLLLAAGLLLLINLVGIFHTLDQRNRSGAAAAREDTLWAAYQLEREAHKLHDALEHHTAHDTDWAADLTQRYDILYSRTTLLTDGQMGRHFGADPMLGEMVSMLRKAIFDLAPHFDALASAGDVPDAELEKLAASVLAISENAARFLIATNARNGEMRVAERAEMAGYYSQLASNAVGITVVFVLFAVMLAFQLRHIRKLRDRSLAAAAAAEAANRSKSAFLATMSHEIRTPLNGILGMADLLDDGRLSPSQRNKVAIIRQSGDTLLDVINDVLDFSKLESGAVDLHVVTFPLSEVLGALEDMMRPRARARGIELRVAAPAVDVTADPARLRQVLINLVGNAIKFTEEGSVVLTTTIRSERGRDSRLEIEIADTGIGMSDETLAGLFQEFVQGDPSISRRFGGTGLGLAICKRLVTAMGGDITVTSHLAVGTTFTISIPCGITVTSTSREAAPVQPRQARHGRVLLVEDNPVNRQVAEALLQRIGMTVALAENGQEALDAVAVRDFDLVLMDMQMPVMDGLTATRRMRTRGINTPVVGLTANAFASDREACLAAGMNDFVTKPVTRAKLEAVIDAIRFSEDDVVPLPLPQPPPAAVEVDLDQQQALIAEFGAEQFAELLAHFDSDAPALLGEARHPLKAVNALHSLKGMARTLGLVAIGDLAEAAEHRARAGETPDLSALAEAVAARAKAAAA